MEDVVFEFHTDTGAVGYGEAPPTGVITGDTTGSIIGAMQDHIRKVLIGREVDEFENCTRALNGCIVKNTSAKAAADMALWVFMANSIKSRFTSFSAAHARAL